MTTANDIIIGALRRINAYAPGDILSSEDANDALTLLNDLLDTWSTEHLTVFNNNEFVANLTPGKFSYTIGTGGDFNTARPLRITNAYTRLTATGSTGIDYPCETISGDEYTSIGLKSQPGPWPKVVYYNENFPLGQLLFWPVPTMGGEFHLWTDNIFSVFANLTDVVSLPQGYTRALKLNLALELAPEYGKTPSELLVDQARKAKFALKALNANPQAPATFDPAIGSSSRSDAGWILHGGFS
jgi:hypothetical protein